MSASGASASSPARGASLPSGQPAKLAGALGSGLLIATVGSVIATLPAALRLGDVPQGRPLAWLLLAAGAALAAGPAGALGRAARPLGAAGRVLLLSVLLATPSLSLLGRVLKAVTHHRPLGATTFALVAALVLVAMVGVAARLVSSMTAAQGARRQLARAAFWFLCAAGAAATLVSLVGLLVGAATAGAAFDGLLLGGVIASAAFAPIPRLAAPGRRTTQAALAVWVLLVVSGLAMASHPALRAEARARAPVYGALATWFVE